MSWVDPCPGDRGKGTVDGFMIPIQALIDGGRWPFLNIMKGDVIETPTLHCAWPRGAFFASSVSGLTPEWEMPWWKGRAGCSVMGTYLAIEARTIH